MRATHGSEVRSESRRAMRKGTRSCYECRKRKVRCIFSKDSSVCEGCALRGKRCIEQSRDLLQDQGLESKESLKERVARLEAIVQASANQKHTRDTPTSITPESDSTYDGTSITHNDNSLAKDSPQNIDPIVTLFDNAIWRRHNPEQVQSSASQAATGENTAAATKNSRTRESLLSGLIPQELLALILSATCSWWHTWHARRRLHAINLSAPNSKPLDAWMSSPNGDENTSTIQDFVAYALTSSDPPIVGLGILCISVCLQQLDARVHQHILRQLPRLPGELFQEYFEKVDRLILNDSDYASSLAGIEAIVLSATIYMNLGLSKKCWLLYHRAISYSQLLGFHRPERLSPAETDEDRRRRNQSWLSLCTGDVLTSLILGLPYAGNARTIPLTQSQHSLLSLLQHRLILISAKVIDRNQMGLSLSVSETQAIQVEIDDATKSLDDTFWNSPAALSSGGIKHHEYLDQIGAQCWLYQVLVLLHMPLMIHSVENVQLANHRTACLDATRNLLKTYHIMRSDPLSAFSMDKMIDYQAFVCSALLILGLLGFGGHEMENKERDRNLIRQTVTTLRHVSGTVNNPVAAQALQGLESLMLLDSEHCPGHSAASCGNPFIKIMVPHAGTVTISPGEYFTGQKSTSASPPAHAPPVFAVSYNIFEQPPANFPVGSDARLDDGQLNGSGSADHMFSDQTFIDFDWTSAIMPNFENDWAWLNNLN